MRRQRKPGRSDHERSATCSTGAGWRQPVQCHDAGLWRADRRDGDDHPGPSFCSASLRRPTSTMATPGASGSWSTSSSARPSPAAASAWRCWSTSSTRASTTRWCGRRCSAASSATPWPVPAITFDLGRWWNFWHIFWPGYFNVNSVMFEVAACITLYIIVMWIEFSPVFLEKLGLRDARRQLEKGAVLLHRARRRPADDAPGFAGNDAGGDGRPGPSALANPDAAPALPAFGHHAGLRGDPLRVLRCRVGLPAANRGTPAQSDGQSHARHHRRLSGRTVRRHRSCAA
jgi:hypothetical protein